MCTKIDIFIAILKFLKTHDLLAPRSLASFLMLPLQMSNKVKENPVMHLYCVYVFGGLGVGSLGLAQGLLQGPWLRPRVTTNQN